MLSDKRQKAIVRKYFIDISSADFRTLLEKYCPEVLVESTRPAPKRTPKRAVAAQLPKAKRYAQAAKQRRH